MEYLHIIEFPLKTRKEIGLNDFITSDPFLSRVKGQRSNDGSN